MALFEVEGKGVVLSLFETNLLSVKARDKGSEYDVRVSGFFVVLGHCLAARFPRNEA